MKPNSISAPEAGRGLRAVAQPVAAPLTRAAIFLVVTLNPGVDNRATVRSFCGDLAALLRAVDFRDLEAGLSCVVGFGSEAWDRLFGPPRPAELHVFREIRAGARHAVSTPGDLLFHIRAKRMDLCFELAMQIMARIGDAVSPVDEVHGFRYFDDRDLMGFVDGTENPRGEAVIDAVIVGEEDAAFAGGSYVIAQKYLHDLDGWNAGWQYSGDFTVASGLPFTVRVLGGALDIQRGVSGSLRANLVPGESIRISAPTTKEWFNTAAFCQPQTPTPSNLTPPCVNPGDSQFGDAGRNILEGPGQVSMDMSLNKTIQIKEYRSLDLRITANNVFNMVYFTSLGTSVNSSTFGEVTGVGNMRRVTVQARFRF